MEQKKEIQGLRTLFSAEGGRYMASEKQVRSNFSSSVLERALAQDGGMLVGEFSLIQTEFAR